MRNTIHPSAVINENVILGDNVYIGPNCTIGFPAEYKEGFGKSVGHTVKIEDNVVLTGNVTIDAGSRRDTVIGEGSFLMKAAYIAHDVEIGKQSIISAHTCLGGHVEVGDFVNIGMGAIVHPRQRIGSHTMIGMGTVITKKAKILPGRIYAGNPSKEIGINKIGLERNGINDLKLRQLINDFENSNEN
ncbi:DapH/DapD/GlmU-related protein [Psychrobacter fozii]|uniref:UDP-N-acetylglucosamine acyltransferase n=1 Tax=Psychrobacter fozii TaxID=198480 RepID=A0A2V4UPU1_9GAMM|nr:DapH/DapD/GlmU-related protein [Psychrobacter fozii]PYE41059.1 UDP-N-acetylglucosamine acyltransferase [Psychrobacter fozii]